MRKEKRKRESDASEGKGERRRAGLAKKGDERVKKGGVLIAKIAAKEMCLCMSQSKAKQGE